MHASIIREGNFDFLVGHPEDFLNKGMIAVLRNCKWTKEVGTIVVDEAHCVVQWSTDFRPKYRDIEGLKSIFPNASFIALTATASIKMRQEILRILNIQSAVVVSGQTDRKNIKYTVERRPSNAAGVETSYTSVFAPLMHELKEKGNSYEKTVVYSQLKWCGFGNEIAIQTLSPGEITLAGVKQVAQFHAPLSAQV